jgi:hypothetical protein
MVMMMMPARRLHVVVLSNLARRPAAGRASIMHDASM